MNVRATRKVMAGAGMAVSVMLLAGCGIIGGGARDERIYVLTPATSEAAGAATVPGVLLVPRPAAQPGLDTDRIALTRPGNELDFYAGSRWGGAMPPVLAALAVQSLTGSFTTVSNADRGVGAGDYELLLTVRHFEAQYDTGELPTVRVTLDCLLVSRAPRRVVGNCDADVREPAAENRMAPIVTAFETAARNALAQVRDKAVAAVRAQPAARPVGAAAPAAARPPAAGR